MKNMVFTHVKYNYFTIHDLANNLNNQKQTDTILLDLKTIDKVSQIGMH